MQLKSNHFAQIFWGLMVVAFDLRIAIAQLNIWPDFLGYILIALGCYGLRGTSRHFRVASILSSLLVIVKILQYAPADWNACFDDNPEIEFLSDFGMIWFLLGGIMELAGMKQRTDIARSASNRRLAYLALVCLTALAILLTGVMPDALVAEVTLAMVVVVACICVFGIQLAILQLLYHARRELAWKSAH